MGAESLVGGRSRAGFAGRVRRSGLVFVGGGLPGVRLAREAL